MHPRTCVSGISTFRLDLAEDLVLDAVQVVLTGQLGDALEGDMPRT